MNGDALQIINALNTRIDTLRTDLAGDISESRKELASSIAALELRITDRIADDQKDHRVMKRALLGLATLVTLAFGANGGPKLLALVEKLI
jgi:hypothetical protein